MTLKKIYESMQPEDFSICIRPTLLADGNWSGDVTVSIMIGDDNPLNDEDYGNMLHFTKMVCASIPMMETSSDLRDWAHSYVMEQLEEEMEIDFEPEPDRGKVLDRQDNVVKISFGTNTEGTA